MGLFCLCGIIKITLPLYRVNMEIIAMGGGGILYVFVYSDVMGYYCGSVKKIKMYTHVDYLCSVVILNSLCV
jgi:hypothetical protein